MSGSFGSLPCGAWDSRSNGGMAAVVPDQSTASQLSMVRSGPGRADHVTGLSQGPQLAYQWGDEVG